MNYNQFPIYSVDRIRKYERDGAFDKAWITHEELGRCLFKKSEPREIINGCQTDWAEKVAHELSKILEIPSARYELAARHGARGSLSVNFVEQGAVRITGETFLSSCYPNYQAEYPSLYTVARTLAALTDRQVKLPSNLTLPSGINNATELFVGYLFLDALIGNDDRHDCNFELVLRKGKILELAPTFDHGKSFGATLSDNSRSKMTAATYSNYLESGFWQDDRKISTLSALQIAAQLQPQAMAIWQQQLTLVMPNQIADIFDRIPDSRITPVAAKFAIDLLTYNRDRITNLEIGPIRKSIPKKTPKKDRGGR